MPIGYGPLVGFPTEQAAPSFQYGPILDTLMQGLNAPPADMPLQPIPQATNPLASMAAIFSASLADQLGHRQQNLAGVQRTLAQQQEDIKAAELANRNIEHQNMLQRQNQRIGYLMKIADVKLKMAQASGDIAAAEKAAREQMDLENKRFEHQRTIHELDNQARMDLASLKQEGSASGGMTSPGGGIKTTEAKNVEDLAAQVYNAQGMTEEKGKFNPFKPNVTVLNDQGKRYMKQKMLPLIRGGTTSDIRQAALSHYLDAYRDESGTITITPGSPQDKEFGDLIQTAIPDPAAQMDFIKAIGIQFK